MHSSGQDTRALTWVLDELMPHLKDPALRVTLYFARHGYVSAPGGCSFSHEDRYRIAPAVGLGIRTVYETVDRLVERGILVRRRERNQFHYLLNLQWRSPESQTP